MIQKENIKMRNLWKIISIILILIVIFAIIDDSTHIARWRIFDWITSIELIIFMVGLFSYSFSIIILSKGFWKAFFIIYLLTTVYEYSIQIIPHKIIYSFSLPIGYSTHLNYNQPEYLVIIINLLIQLPLFYPLYRLANKNTK